MNNYTTKLLNSTSLHKSIANCKEYFTTHLFNYVPADCNCWIAGGALRSFFCQEKINDIDIYFATEQDYNTFRLINWVSDSINSFTVSSNSSACGGNITMTPVSSKNVHLKTSYDGENSRKVIVEGLKLPPLDLIKLFYPTPLDSLKSFDFTVSVDNQENYIFSGFTFSEDIATTPNAIQNSSGGSADVLILKMDNQFENILMSTYWGGNGTERAQYNCSAGSCKPQVEISSV